MDAYDLLFAAFAFAFGASIGSFLNVCIYRLPRDLSVNEPRRSFCPSCKYQIPWWNNLPLVSWLALRGKCANCGARIALRYFGVELLTGLLFLAVWLTHPLTVALSLWVFVALLVVATFIDFEHFIIPDEITWGGVIAGILLNFLLAPFALPYGDLGHWFTAIAAVALFGGSVWFGLALGGPLKAMRAPARVFTSAFIGLAAALVIEGILGGWTSFSATFSSALGAIAGYFLLWGVVEVGKVALGRKRVVLEKAERFTWTRRGDDADFACGEDQQLWSELFSRESDRLLMKCTEITIAGNRYTNVDVEFHYNRVRIPGSGGGEWRLDQLDTISGSVTEIVIPREAMGFGDVKFLACIGAFIGWQGALFTFVAASTIGAVIGLFMIAIGKRELGGKIPFGPYLSVAALLWVFDGPRLTAWILKILHPSL